jgi:hypothetical protein
VKVSLRTLAVVGAGAVIAVIAIPLLFPGPISEWHLQREFAKHREFLTTLLRTTPTVAQVDAALDEPYTVASAEDARTLAYTWTNPSNSPEEVLQKMKTWPVTRVYLRSPMVYFIYFDSSGVMRDFSCLSN